jgi:hypothetical protein
VFLVLLLGYSKKGVCASFFSSLSSYSLRGVALEREREREREMEEKGEGEGVRNQE